MQAAVSPALRDDKIGEVSIYEMNGCDSADNGAWLDAEIKDTISKEEIFSIFESHGWSTNPMELPECNPGVCGAELAKKVGSQLFGIRFIHREEQGVWELEIVSL